MEATESGGGYTLDGREDVRDRRSHRRPRSSSSRARPARRGTDGISFFTVAGDADGPHPHAARDDGHDAQAGEARVRQRRGRRRSASTGRRLGRVLARRSTRPRSRSRNEMMGGAQKVLEMSVEYAKVRVQFGRPIGSFQAIKHKCADMLLEVESGKSAAYYASWAAAEDNDELPGGRRARRRRTAPRRTSTPPPRTSRSTAASASRGSTPRTSTSSARSAPRSSSATRRTTASCSRSASASDRPVRSARSLNDPELEFTVAAFNAHWGVGAVRALRSGARFDVAAIVRGFDADVVVVPEVVARPRRSRHARRARRRRLPGRDRCRSRPTSTATANRGRGHPGEGVWELAMCSRLPVTRGGRSRSARPRAIPSGPRSALACTVDVNGTPVDIVGVHVSSKLW